MERFYYENKLSNQNITAKPNIAWAADITEFELVGNKKVYVFLCLNIHTNSIIAHTAGKKMPASSAKMTRTSYRQTISDSTKDTRYYSH